MNKISSRIITLIVCGVLALSGLITAVAVSNEKSVESKKSAAAVSAQEEPQKVSKDETVYVLAGADGSVKKIIVSDWIRNALGTASLKDSTALNNIENVKGDETYTVSGNAKVWDAQGNDIYYKGNIEKELPVGLSVSYKLGGKPVSADEIAGKSGKITIRFDYENEQYEKVKIDGREEKIYVPFVMLTGMLLDNENFRNIEVSNGKLINDGDRTAVVGIALPGMQENLGIDKEKFELPDFVEITADAVNFSFGMTVTIATNELFNKFDVSKLDSVSGLTSSIGDLAEGMQQLMDGSSALYGGLCTLLDKSEELVSGISALAEGAKELKEGIASADDGAAQIKSGVQELSEGLNTLKANNDTLNGGAKQVFETLLSTAEAQIKAAGISIPSLSIESYAEILNGVIASLDETLVYNQALAGVTAAVEENRSLIVGKVTAAVKEQVAEQVIQNAASMSKSDYEAAVAAGRIPKATQQTITGAIDEQMKTTAVQAKISETVELQIKQAISDNMASDEVKAKLAAASEGAKSIISLKTSLDSYNAFYLGLLTYTGGVASAADGTVLLSSGVSELKDGTSQLKSGASALYDGILQLKNGTPALVEGVTQLKNGAMQLSGGLKTLNDEGIQKIVNLAGVSLKTVITRFKATVDVSKNYRNFAGISDDMEGSVKFIYRTDEIKAKQ